MNILNNQALLQVTSDSLPSGFLKAKSLESYGYRSNGASWPIDALQPIGHVFNTALHWRRLWSYAPLTKAPGITCDWMLVFKCLNKCQWYQSIKPQGLRYECVWYF